MPSSRAVVEEEAIFKQERCTALVQQTRKEKKIKTWNAQIRGRSPESYA